jgi:sugar lactone lactonase YvrE
VAPTPPGTLRGVETNVRRIPAEVALQATAALGEGPVWDDERGELVWVDILDGRVHRFDPGSVRDRSVELGRPVGAVALRRDGGYVVAVEDGFALLSERGSNVDLIAPVGADDPRIRFNDGKCDPAGRFWAGTIAYEETPGAAALYRLDPDLQAELVLDGLTVSNGLAWTPDGREMFFIDSPTGGVDAFAFDLESGWIDDRRRVVDVPADRGMPDGMTLDADGGLWVALYGGAAVHRYLPDGTLDTVVELPVTNVTSCTFGGPSLEDLYVTTARQGLGERELAAQPLAGSVFTCRPGVAGRLPDRFGG